jgi:hypothetical protein
MAPCHLAHTTGTPSSIATHPINTNKQQSALARPRDEVRQINTRAPLNGRGGVRRRECPIRKEKKREIDGVGLENTPTIHNATQRNSQHNATQSNTAGISKGSVTLPVALAIL